MSLGFDPFQTTEPRVLIVGRPNVGKSRLFNQLGRSREAIVNDQAGVTVDVKGIRVVDGTKSFVLIDSGGFDLDAHDPISEGRNAQVLDLIASVEAILVVVDAREGCTPGDDMIWNEVRTRKRPECQVWVLANKSDDPARKYAGTLEFYNWGIDPLQVSAEHSVGIDTLSEELIQKIGRVSVEGSEMATVRTVRFAIIGRPNVGKSTWCNQFLGHQRSVVSEIPGTTRDVLMGCFEFRGTSFEILDTAGVRRAARRKKEIVEAVASDKALRSTEEVDVALLVVDASEGITQLDAKLAHEAWTRGAGLVVLANKWDRVSDLTFKQWCDWHLRKLSYFGDVAAVVPGQGLTGDGREVVLKKIFETAKKRYLEMDTNVLNEKFRSWIRQHPHPTTASGNVVQINYVLQSARAPLRLLVFSNRPREVSPSYLRYLEKKIREEFRIGANPVYMAVTEKR